jgi:hypothetical protein
MTVLLRVLVGGLGFAGVLIGAAIMVAGAGAVGASAEGVFNAISGSSELSPPWPATMDSELRFYAALFVGFGLLCLRAARNPAQHGKDVPWLMLAFFAGGLGRALSWVSVGAPHPFFLTLMAVELALPPIILMLWWFAAPASRG